jgi:hypothetical protein
MALGGMMAALAVVIMCLGGLIPIATYVCPVICTLLLSVVLKRCGKRDAWAWYGAVSVLCLLMAPDKEAAAVFLFLGYYPIVKPVLDRKKCSWIWKGLLFNLSVLAMYWLLIALLGMESTTDSFRGVGYAMLAVMLVMGNVTFFMLDRLLTQVRSIR